MSVNFAEMSLLLMICFGPWQSIFHNQIMEYLVLAGFHAKAQSRSFHMVFLKAAKVLCKLVIYFLSEL